MKAREMCPMTLLALADELDREARFFARGNHDDEHAARLRGIATRYRKRSRLARGGWAAARELQTKLRGSTECR